jgi:hypothetical protein
VFLRYGVVKSASAESRISSYSLLPGRLLETSAESAGRIPGSMQGAIEELRTVLRRADYSS